MSKKLQILFSVCFLLNLLNSASLIAEETIPAKQTLAVLDFESPSLSKDEIRLFTDQIASYVAENGLFILITRSQRESLLEELEFSASGITDEKQNIELGKLLSANLLLTGNIGSIGSSRFWFNMKLITTSTGEVSRSISKEYKSLTQLLDDSKKATLALVDPENHGSKDYQIVYGPEQHSKHNFIGTGYNYTNYTFSRVSDSGTSEITIKTDSISLWLTGIQGSRLVFQWASSFIFPFQATNNDQPIDLGLYAFPWGVHIFAGPGYIFNINTRIKILTALDVHYSQLTLWPTKREEDWHYSLVYITFGLGADASFFYRVQENNYIRIGCNAGWDFYNAMQGVALGDSGDALQYSFTASPYLLLGSAR